MQITIIRHGYSEANKNHLLVGQVDSKLTEEGIEELTKLRESVDYPKGDIYYCSDLTRAKQTFSILYPDVKDVIYTKVFREVNYGINEAASEKDLKFREYFIKWLHDERIADEESKEEFTNRIYNGLCEVLKDGKEKGYESIVIVCHAILIKCLLLKLQILPLEKFFEVRITNGKGFIFDLDYDGEIIVNSYKELD